MKCMVGITLVILIILCCILYGRVDDNVAKTLQAVSVISVTIFGAINAYVAHANYQEVVRNRERDIEFKKKEEERERERRENERKEHNIQVVLIRQSFDCFVNFFYECDSIAQNIYEYVQKVKYSVDDEHIQKLLHELTSCKMTFQRDFVDIARAIDNKLGNDLSCQVDEMQDVFTNSVYDLCCRHITFDTFMKKLTAQRKEMLSILFR